MASDEKTIEGLIEALPENFREEVIDFIDFLLSKSRSAESRKRGETAEPSGRLDPAKDPLLAYVGSIEHGSLAKDIDKALYGESL